MCARFGWELGLTGTVLGLFQKRNRAPPPKPNKTIKLTLYFT